MNENEVLERIADGENAYSLLYDADKRLIRQFHRLTTNLNTLLDDVQKYFPDATYYTASGGFNLLLGKSHSDKGKPQQELSAVGAIRLVVGDGDY